MVVGDETTIKAELGEDKNDRNFGSIVKREGTGNIVDGTNQPEFPDAEPNNPVEPDNNTKKLINKGFIIEFKNSDTFTKVNLKFV